MSDIVSPQRRLGLFDVIERIQGDVPWGSVLDAGTGTQSARWIAGLTSTRWTAVSADAGHLAETRDAVSSKIRTVDRLIVGNWSDANFLANDVFDTVLAEYLLGAIEGYAPYFQYQLFARLRPHVGRTLYVIGVDPYLTGRCDSATGEIVQSVGRFRDACAVLAGVNHYREYPAEWVMDRLQHAGLRILFSRRFPSTHDLGWIDRQLTDSRELINRLPENQLARVLSEQAVTLRQRAAEIVERDGHLAHGQHYLIAAEPI